MTIFPSKHSAEKLSERWDEYTSPARFAGNDDTMDLIFVSKHKGNKVKLIRKARTSFELFSCVFRGKIASTKNGSEIRGFFTKSAFDYSLVAGILALLFYIRFLILERGGSINAINTLLVMSIIGGIIFLYNRRSTKRRYAEFIFRITEEETNAFKRKKEINEMNDVNKEN